MGDQAIFAAASGALVQEMRLEVLTNNLANIDTVGYKGDRAVFSNYLDSASASDILPTAGTNDLALNNSTMVKFEGTQTDYSGGSIKQTNNQLDFALEGDGFFCIESEDGIQRFTRKGNFKLGESGDLVTQDEKPVLGSSGRGITISGSELSVDEKGNIMVDGAIVDSLKIVDFNRPYSLIKVGDSAFMPADVSISEKEAEGTKVRQGAVELSNVNPVSLMTEMIEVHRAFESYQKIIRSMDEIISKSINEVGRSS